MAQTLKINSILADLVDSFATSSSQRNPRKIKQSKESAAKKVKAHQYVRTNQFEVETTLNGLIEKFSIVNRDDLADALTKRLNELESISKSKWTPELLSLFLNLSDRPDEKSTLEALELLKPPSPPPSPITWEELDAEEPLTGDVWLDESYSSASEDEFEAPEKDTLRARGRFEAATITEDDTAAITTELVSTNTLTSLKSAQFWNKSDLYNSRPQLLSELQISREVLYMLHGLPTSLFAIDTEHTLIYHATNIMLAKVSLSGLNDILQSFASIGSDILRLRAWSRKSQRVPLLQAFSSAVCTRLRYFDRTVADIEHRYTHPKAPVVISILQLHQDVETMSRPIMALSALATKVPDHGGDFICLELLYNQLCSLQASGDEECCEMLGEIFFECLQVYLRPVALWMEEGTILETDESFFIAVADKGSSPTSLWHDRYMLRTSADGLLHAPKFLHPAAKNILNAGKSIVFLQNLQKEAHSVHGTSTVKLTYGAVCKENAMSTLLPFPELFSIAFSEWIGSKYGPASSILKKHLFDNCSLLRHLDSLEYTFFSKDGVVFQTFADELFQRMRSQSGDWNDKFLLSELARRTFGSLDIAKASSLSVRIVRPRRTSHRAQALAGVLLDINLPWAVQNIIQRSSMTMYQSIFCFLLQIYHAKYILRSDNFNLRQTTSTPSRLAIGIHQQLAWFTNVIHSYITETVIQASVEELRDHLETAADMDAMCELHETFVTRLQLSSLLAHNLAPIHDSIISLLDLAVLYSDAQNSRMPAGKGPPKTGSPQKFRSQRGRRRHRVTKNVDEESLEGLSSSDNEQSEADDESWVEATPLVDNDKPYEERLHEIYDQFSQLLHFTVAGLRGVSRAGGELAWEMLAERLEWGLQKPSRSTHYY